MSNVLWGAKVSASKPLAVESNDTAHLHITNCALAFVVAGKEKGKKDLTQSSATVLSLTIGGEKFALATLRPISCDQFELNLPLHAATGKTYYLTADGPGEVHVTGVYEAVDEPYGDSEDDFGGFNQGDSDDDDDDEDDEDMMMMARKFGVDNDSDDDEEDDDNIIPPSGATVEGVNSDDEEEEEESSSKGSSDDRDSPRAKSLKRHDTAGTSVKKSTTDSKKRQEPEGGKTSEQPSKKSKSAALDQSAAGAVSSFHCDACNKSFQTEKALQQHNQSKHKA
jgi:hypothetical protein